MKAGALVAQATPTFDGGGMHGGLAILYIRTVIRNARGSKSQTGEVLQALFVVARRGACFRSEPHAYLLICAYQPTGCR